MKNTILILLFFTSLLWGAENSLKKKSLISIDGSYSHLEGHFAKEWKMGASGGGTLTLPTISEKLFLSFALSYGSISYNHSAKEFWTLLPSIRLEYPHRVQNDIELFVFGGVANLFVAASDAELRLSHPFAGEKENEFGFLGGLGGRYWYNSFFSQFNIAQSYIFSDPKRVLYTTFTLSLGKAF